MALANGDIPLKTSRLSGWIKAGLTSLCGVLSGAAVMYATTLVNKELAPPQPVANFECQVSGLEVTFHNRSANCHDGWWDFGDESALVPFAPDQATVQHKYSKAGSYSVKLTLKNLLGDQNERTVTVVVDGAVSSPPSIDAFVVMPVNGDSYAPATFHVATRVKDANSCIWAISDRPIEITDAATADRSITFKDPGTYTVKLAATNGTQVVEKMATVQVQKAPLGAMAATVQVTYEAVFVESKSTKPVVQLQFLQAGTLFKQDFAPDSGFDFVTAAFDAQMKYSRFKVPPTLQISADKKQLTVSGELVSPVAKNATLSIPLAVTQQRASAPVTKVMDPLSVNLTVPGTTLVPLPALPPGWLATKRTLALTIVQDGKQYAWKAGELPQNVGVQMASSRLFVVTASEQPTQLRIDLSEVKGAMELFGN